MFYDQFVILCNKKGVSTSKAALENDISKTSVTRWKKGAIPNAEILQRLSGYFGVSVDYLLGNTSEHQEILNKSLKLIQGYTANIKNEISTRDERIIKLIDGLNEENKAKIKDYIDLLILKQEKECENDKK